MCIENETKYFEIYVRPDDLSQSGYFVYVKDVLTDREAMLQAKASGKLVAEGAALVSEISEYEYKKGVEKNKILEHIEELKKQDPEMRIIQVRAGMSPEYEMIATNAPDHIIGQQLHIDMTREAEGFAIEDPYDFIVKAGYVCVYLYSNDDVVDLEFEYEYDTSFDWYSYDAFDVSGSEEVMSEIIEEMINMGNKNDTIDMLHKVAEKRLKKNHLNVHLTSR